MWERFIKCLSKAKGGAANNKNKCKFLNLSDLYKRVPANQRKQFKLFMQKNEQYKARMDRFPTSMPKIDWKYYQTNVRPEYVTWVKHFQDQYEQFDTFFENRHVLIDTSKYFTEVEEQKKEVEKQVEAFKKESNDKIKCFEYKLKNLNELMPYDQMTMEEFCFARPESAPDFINKPTFWPHTPEEQKPGPADPDYVVQEETEVNMVKPKDEGPKKEPPKPPKTPTDGEPAAKDPKAELKTETSPSKRDDPNSKDTQKVVCKTRDSQAKPESPIDVEKMTETASELANKGSAIAKDLAQKAAATVKVWVEKLNEKRKEVEVAANRAREKAKKEKEEAKKKQGDEETVKKQKESVPAAPKAKLDPNEVDSIYFREGSKHICHNTIIKGEEEENVQVKEKHTTLNEIFEEPIEIDDDVKYKKKSLKFRRKPLRKEEEDEEVCELQEKHTKKEKTKISQGDEQEEASCTAGDIKELKEKVKECLDKQDCKGNSDESFCLQTFLENELKKRGKEDERKAKPCKPQKDTKASVEKDPEKCTLNLESSHPSSSFESPEPVDVVGRTKTPNKTHSQGDTKTNEKATLEDFDTKVLETSIFLGQHKKSKDEDNQFNLDDNSKSSKDLQSKERTEEEAEEYEDNVKPESGKKTTVYPKLMIHAKPRDEEEVSSPTEKPTFSPPKEKPSFISQPSSAPPEKTKKTNEVLGTAQEMAKTVFNMATDAANLLSDATSAVEEAKKEKSSRIEIMEAAYLAAQKQADRALAEAYKAMGAAKKLTQRSQRSKEENNSEPEELVMTEKHAMLAKLLARRAITLKKEIAKVLQDLKDKQ